jgi:hypothetical protein
MVMMPKRAKPIAHAVKTISCRLSSCIFILRVSSSSRYMLIFLAPDRFVSIAKEALRQTLPPHTLAAPLDTHISLDGPENSVSPFEFSE